MTQEEAQQLIAEIENAYLAQDSFLNRSAVEQIKKIITRFANKPPYILTTDDEQMYLDMRQHTNSKHKDKTLIRIQHVGQDVDDANYGIGLTISELKQLRDNINKMLEYLENNKEEA